MKRVWRTRCGWKVALLTVSMSATVAACGGGAGRALTRANTSPSSSKSMMAPTSSPAARSGTTSARATTPQSSPLPTCQVVYAHYGTQAAPLNGCGGKLLGPTLDVTKGEVISINGFLWFMSADSARSSDPQVARIVSQSSDEIAIVANEPGRASIGALGTGCIGSHEPGGCSGVLVQVDVSGSSGVSGESIRP